MVTMPHRQSGKRTTHSTIDFDTLENVGPIAFTRNLHWQGSLVRSIIASLQTASPDMLTKYYVVSARSKFGLALGSASRLAAGLPTLIAARRLMIFPFVSIHTRTLRSQLGMRSATVQCLCARRVRPSCKFNLLYKTDQRGTLGTGLLFRLLVRFRKFSRSLMGTTVV